MKRNKVKQEMAKTVAKTNDLLLFFNNNRK